MPPVLFSYHSTGYVSATMISVGLAVYLLTLRNKATQTWLLGAYFLATATLSAGFLLRAVVFAPEIAKPASYFTALYTCFSNVVLLAFAYSFPENYHKRESRIATMLFATIGIIVYAYYILTTVGQPVHYNFDTLLHEFQKPESAKPMGIAHTVTFFWILALCVRKSYQAYSSASRSADPETGRTLQRQGKAMRVLALAILLHICFAGAYALYTARKISFADFQLLLTAAISIQLFVYALIYFNYSNQPTTFLVKIVGISLLTLLVVLCLIYRITFHTHEAGYASSVHREIAMNAGGFAPRTARIIDVSLKQGDMMPDSEAAERSCSASTPRMFHRDPSDLWSYLTEYCLPSARGEIRATVYYLDFRQSMHNHMLPLVASMVALGTLMVALFPLFFYVGLIAPLRSLLQGVRRVNEADYEAEVLKEFEDEIGYLSLSFNKMVASIRENRARLAEYAQDLEEKVQERTRRLQETLEQVQELKIRQDGDYYLSSLLVAPVTQNKAESEKVRVECLIRQMKQFQYKGWQAEIGGDMNVTRNIVLRSRSYTAFLNADAMGKSLQGAAGALVLGAVFEAILKRSVQSSVVRNLSPERWLKNAFIELHSVFMSFECSMMASALFGLVDESCGLLYYICAEHPAPVLYRERNAVFLPVEHQYYKFGIPFTQGPISVNTFQMKPLDVVISGSDGRHDLLIQNEAAAWVISQDEEAFLEHVERGGGQLESIYQHICAKGRLIDDLSLLRISYETVEEAQSPDWVEIKPRLIELQRNKKYRKIVDLARQALALSRPHGEMERLLFAMCAAAHRSNDLDTAVQSGLRYLDIRPDDTYTMAMVARLLQKRGELKEAAELGERVRLRMPGYRRNLQILAGIYATTGDDERAEILRMEASDVG